MSLTVKIVELPPTYYEKFSRKRKPKKIRDGYCRACGSKLTDKLSIKRGYGPGCFEKYTAIVFEMIPDTKPE